jgi:uncharacterized YigZ family protein
VDDYKTIAFPSEGSLKIKGSHFIGLAYPILSEVETKEYLQQARALHPKANHVCYGYRLGEGQEISRYSDDQEPSGTAGKPILGQIIRYGLEDVMILVVRYFGGILLGSSGLIKAYRSAAEISLAHAEIVERKRETRFVMTLDYESIRSAELFLSHHQGRIITKSFNELIHWNIAFPRSKAAAIRGLLQQELRRLQWPGMITLIPIEAESTSSN